MNAHVPHPDEDSILTWLVACDQALAAGAPPQASSFAETPIEWRERLEGNVACIQMLRQLLPRRATGEAAEGAAGLGRSSTGAEPVLPELPFRQLGRFQIRGLLGQGAFGMVFLAADPQLDREVALKVPRPEALLTSEVRERFLREARAAAGLDHPNLVPVYEAGVVGPFCYIASAYCPGITLSQWLKERSELTPVRLAAALVATLADAVGHAHARGVIHRDLKPSNVLLQAKRRNPAGADSTVQDLAAAAVCSEEEIVPRITDFGLAKLTAAAPAPPGEEGAQTRSGAVLGTPNYMAPEQASGRNKEVGPAADIYALGAILYELLTGRPPFRGETLLELLEQVRSRDPLSPSRLRPKLPRDLETICLKCLHKEPHKRYGSAAALADDLRRYLAGEPIQARPIRAWERGMKWARRQPALALLLAVSILGPLVLLAVVLGYNAQLRQALDDKDNALIAKDEKQREANENFRLARSAVDDFAIKVSRDNRLLAHDLEGLRKDLLQSAQKFYVEFVQKRAEDAEVQFEQAQALSRLADLTRELGSPQEAINIFQKSVTVLQELTHDHPDTPQYPVFLSRVLNQLAAAYLSVRKTDLAEDSLKEAKRLQQLLVQRHPAVPEYQTVLAGASTNLGSLYQEIGRTQLAEAEYDKARKLYGELHQAHPDVEDYQHGLASTYNSLGRLFMLTSRPNEAIRALREGRNLYEKLVRDRPIKSAYQEMLAKSLNSLALVYAETGRHKEAVDTYHEAEGIWRKLADEHPKIPTYSDGLATIYVNLGIAQENLHNPDQAKAAYTEAIMLREKLVRNYPGIPEYQFRLVVHPASRLTRGTVAMPGALRGRWRHRRPHTNGWRCLFQ